MSRHDELDSQLPWIQVHRSVGAKAAALAARCGADYYRVRGILEAFWESLADRRVLGEALPPKGPGCVVLDAEEVVSRVCRLISPTCTPEDLEATGFLEAFQDLAVHPRPVSFWRVRGMSRYLDAERTRLARRGGRTTVRPHSDPTPTPTTPPTPPGSDPTEERGERREVRGERKDDDVVPPPEPVDLNLPPPVDLQARAFELHQNLTPPDKPTDAWGGEDFWRWAQVTRRGANLLVEKWPHPRSLSTWWGEARAVASVEALQEAFFAFGEDPHWKRAAPPCPWAGFRAQWAKYVPQGPGGARAAAR